MSRIATWSLAAEINTALAANEAAADRSLALSRFSMLVRYKSTIARTSGRAHLSG